MLPPCFRLAERIFPLVRHDAAHRLAAAGHTQKEIGRRLGVSQAMVSKYLKADPPVQREEDQWIVHQMAEEITQQDLMDVPSESDTNVNAWCRTLGLTTGEHHEDRRSLVADLLMVLKRLRDTDTAPLLPAVGMNLAGALPGARDPGDVAAFPGRLAHVQATLRAHAPPEFGASNHLARVLITAQRSQPAVRFAANLAGTEATVQAARKSRERLIDAQAQHRDEAHVARFEAPTTAFALFDSGGFGIEPALYILDNDAVALARRIERLAERLRKKPPA